MGAALRSTGRYISVRQSQQWLSLDADSQMAHEIEVCPTSDMASLGPNALRTIPISSIEFDGDGAR